MSWSVTAVTAPLTLAIATLLPATTTAWAQGEWPIAHRAYVDYDPAIPPPRAVLGHDPGEVITPPDGLVLYFRALADAAPDRTLLVEYAESWEGRPLVMLAIGSPARMARIDEVKAGLARLADPRGLSRADEARLVAELPVVTALVHSVHGNEIAGGVVAGIAFAEDPNFRGYAEGTQLLFMNAVLFGPSFGRMKKWGNSTSETLPARGGSPHSSVFVVGGAHPGSWVLGGLSPEAGITPGA
jgi:hypothetical protein